ncbi:hypothetical protein [Lentzea atacamensis]|uniref:hypothetical protein n=1 Tax=Lentzea atacamensis TaxID=531938 RepID=UPI0011BDA3DB|nr:hypothetical protein [Lentzea atacamensis]
MQTIDVARLTTHPVPLVPGTFIAVSGQGPRGDSNGSGKTSFLAAVSILLADPQWQLHHRGGRIAAGVLFRADSAGVKGLGHNASTGYIIGVFADDDDPHQTAVTVWIRLETSKPYFQVRWADGVHLANDPDEQQRYLQADSIWQSLRGNEPISASRMAEVLYGDSPRCLAYLDTPLRPPVPSLLSQQMTEMAPKDIGESLIALSGSKGHLDEEREQRGQVLEQRRKRDASLAQAAERDARDTADLRAIDDRDAARAELTAAETSWRQYVALMYAQVQKADRLAAEEIEALAEQHGAAAAQAKAAEDELAGLRRNTDLSGDEARRRDAWTKAKKHTSDLRLNRTRVSERHTLLVDERNRLLGGATDWDGRSAVETLVERDKAVEDRNRKQILREAADQAVGDAQAELQRAEEGRAGNAGQIIDALRAQQIDSVALFDVLEVDEAVRRDWEPRLWAYRDAVVVEHDLLEEARNVIADVPGALIITTDDEEGSLPDGVRCRLPVTAFLHALSNRFDTLFSPPGALDSVLGLTVTGGFAEPQTGHDAVLTRLRRELSAAREKLNIAAGHVQLAEAALALAVARHDSAVAAERLEVVNSEEQELASKIATLDGALVTAEGEEERRQSEWESARDALSGYQHMIAALDVKLAALRETEKARLTNLMNRKKRRQDLDVEEWRALRPTDADDTDNPYDEQTSSNPADLRLDAVERLTEALRLFGIDPFDAESAPDELRECVTLRVALARHEGGKAPQTALTTIALPLRTKLDVIAGADKVTRTRIVEQRAEHQRIHHGLELDLADAEMRLGVLQDMISQRVEGILSRVSNAFNRLDEARGGNGADLHVATSVPDGAAEWVWEVTPRWKRSRSGGHVSYREVANGAQVKVYAVQLVLAAVLADSETHGRVLVLDELGNSLGEVNRKDVLRALKRVAQESRVTILGTCQDSVLVDAADVCGQLLWFSHVSESDAYNRPTRVWGFNEMSEQVELTAGHIRSGREKEEGDD